MNGIQSVCHNILLCNGNAEKKDKKGGKIGYRICTREESDVTSRCTFEKIRLEDDVNSFVSLSHSLNDIVAQHLGTFFGACVFRTV